MSEGEEIDWCYRLCWDCVPSENLVNSSSISSSFRRHAVQCAQTQPPLADGAAPVEYLRPGQPPADGQLPHPGPRLYLPLQVLHQLRRGVGWEPRELVVLRLGHLLRLQRGPAGTGQSVPGSAVRGQRGREDGFHEHLRRGGGQHGQ